jgi:hypothetical protein
MLDKIKPKWNIQNNKPARSKDGKGQSLVEMAILTPLLLLMFIGVLEVGWAIRGYIVLVNADREATRFAARGWYLDFNQNDINDIGYGNVLSHTLDSISQQLPFDVVSDDPNGTLIVSHYIVDTGKPCADPPCNDDCAADHQNHHGGCDCTTPERREPDYVYDDWVAHPGMTSYSHFSALYGLPNASRLDHDAVVAELKEQNDAFNCALNVKDPSAPWSPNSVVAVEMFYDQPQLVGVPIIANHFTDPVPLYAHTVMRITGDRGNKGGEGGGCTLLPVAVHESTVDALEEGESTGDIRNGTGTGNFGWLRWTDDTDAISANSNSEEYLEEEIKNPRLSMNDYREPEHKDANDEVINSGDWVWGLTGQVSSDGVVKEQMTDRIGQVHRVPIWNIAEGSGSNVVYHIVGFALFRLDSIDFQGNPKTISGTYMGRDDTCKGNGH